MSYANLGGLGAREGTPVAHTWEPPPPPPPPPPWLFAAGATALRVVLPLLLLLPLFLLRMNRTRAAWWIWLPVGVTALGGIGLVCLVVDGDLSLQRAICALATALGAMWLLMPWLPSRYRVVTFLKMLPLLAGFSLLAFVPTLVTGEGGGVDFWPYLAGLLGFASLVAALALTLAGVCVRRRFGRIRFGLWLAGWIALGWTVILTPFYLYVISGIDNSPSWGQLLLGILLTSGLTLGVLLPPVLLSFFQSFYRARFLTLLNLPQTEPLAGAGGPPRFDELAQAATDRTVGPTAPV